MSNSRGVISLFVAGIFLFQGCATVVDGRQQDLMIRSKPEGASVLVDGTMTGTTPMVASLERRKRHKIELTQPGTGKKVTRATTRGFNWWYLGNLIFIYGLVVDPITGAIYEVNPSSVYVDFDNPDILSEGA